MRMIQGQDIETAKHVVDAAAVGSGIMVWLNLLQPVASAIAGILTIAWLAFRLYDMWLSIKIKRKQLKDE